MTRPSLFLTALATALFMSTGSLSHAQDGGQTLRLRELVFPPLPEGTPPLPEDVVSTLDSVLQTLTVRELQAFMDSRELTSELLTRYYLERIARLDDRYRTYLEINPEALNEAREADRLREEGEVLGPLHGIPVSLKDNIGTAAPMHTTAGAEILLDYVPDEDAPLVRQLREGGAVILGKANLSELAGVISLGQILGGSTAIGGQGVNPHGDFPTGGSSSGSAGAVAANMAVVSVGSETSGSLIAPAAWNSVVGMKPSRDLVSGEGVIPLLLNNDSPGPIARNVTDAAALLQVIDTAEENYLEALATDSLSGVVVGVLAQDIAGEGSDLMARIATALVVSGADVRHASFHDGAARMATFGLFLAGGIRYDMMDFIGSEVPGFDTPEALQAYNAEYAARRIPFTQALLEGKIAEGADLTREAFATLGAELTAAATETLERAFAESGAEVLVSIENTHSQIYATAGYPAITVPLGTRSTGGIMPALGRDPAGMPAGVTLIGKPGEDAALLGYAYAFEQASKLRLIPEIAQ